MSMSIQPWSTKSTQQQQSHNILNKGSNLNFHSYLLWISIYPWLTLFSIADCLVLSGEYTVTYKYWEWIKWTNTATRKASSWWEAVNPIYIQITIYYVNCHDHKPIHNMPHSHNTHLHHKHTHYHYHNYTHGSNGKPLQIHQKYLPTPQNYPQHNPYTACLTITTHTHPFHYKPTITRPRPNVHHPRHNLQVHPKHHPHGHTHGSTQNPWPIHGFTKI